MSRKNLVSKMVRAYFDERYGLCCGNAAMRKGAHCLAVTQYASNWLAEHGELPQGVHTCVGRADWISGKVLVTADFGEVWRHVPSSRLAAGTDPASEEKA